MSSRRVPDFTPPPDLFADQQQELGLLRSMREEDLDAVLQLEHIAQPSAWSREVFRKELELEWSHAWVLEEQPNAIGGFGIAAYLIFWTIVDELHVLNIVVHPLARRRGIAKRMLVKLDEMAQRREMSVISLEVRAGNVAARRLYGDLGFAEVGGRSNYYPDNQEDAVLLAKIVEEPEAASSGLSSG